MSWTQLQLQPEPLQAELLQTDEPLQTEADQIEELARKLFSSKLLLGDHEDAVKRMGKMVTSLINENENLESIRVASWNVNGLGINTKAGDWMVIASLTLNNDVVQLSECFGGAQIAKDMAAFVKDNLFKHGGIDPDTIEVFCNDKSKNFNHPGQGLVTIVKRTEDVEVVPIPANVGLLQEKALYDLETKYLPELLFVLLRYRSRPVLMCNAYLSPARDNYGIRTSQIGSFGQAIKQQMEAGYDKLGVYPSFIGAGDLNAEFGSQTEIEALTPAASCLAKRLLGEPRVAPVNAGKSRRSELRGKVGALLLRIFAGMEPRSIAITTGRGTCSHMGTSVNGSNCNRLCHFFASCELLQVGAREK